MVIISNNMKKGIKKIEKLVVNRVLPKRKREDFHYTHQFLYDLMLRNLYLFKSSVHYYFLYPMNMLNDALRTYWQNIIIENYFTTSFQFTIFEEHSDSPSTFDFTDITFPVNPIPNLDSSNELLFNSLHNFLKSLNYLRGMVFFKSDKITYDIKQYIARNIMYKLKVFKNSYKGDDYYNSFSTVFETLEKQVQADNNSLTNLTCFEFFNLKRRNKISLSMLDMNDVFIFFDLIQSAYKYISLNGDDYSSDKQIFFDSQPNWKFIELFNFVKKVLYGKDTGNIDTNQILKTTINSIETFTKEFLVKANNWKDKLLSVYYNVNTLDKKKILNELQALYDEIPKMNLKNETLLKKILFIVYRSIRMFLQGTISCSQLENGAYQFYVKTDILRLDEIVNKVYCPGEVESIQMFALNKIIFNVNMSERVKKMQVNITAPIWEVSSNVTVHLGDFVTKNKVS